MKITLRPHQVKMHDWITATLQDKGVAYLHAGMRVGKTLTILNLIEQGHYRKVIIFAPVAAIAGAWEQDYQYYEGELPLIILMGAKTKRLKTLAEVRKGNGAIVVTSYESAWRTPIRTVDWDLVVADEAHKLKSYNSKVSNMLAYDCAHVPHKVAMTGTGFDSSLLDAYGQFRWLLPDTGGNRRGHAKSALFGTYQSFFNTYAVYENRDNYQLVKGFKNEDQLGKIISPYTLKIKTEEVLDGLPPVTDVTIPLQLSKSSKDLYKDIATENYGVTEDGSVVVTDNPLVRALRLQQVSSGFAQTTDGLIELKDNPKLTALADLLDSTNEPIVVFTRFKQEVEHVAALCKRMGIPHHRLTGEVKEHLIWQSGSGQVLIANIQAGGTGVTLSRASIAVYYTLPLSGIDYMQSRYRLVAPHNKITYYTFLTAGTLEPDLYKALQNKQDVRDTIIKHLEGLQ